MWWFDVCTVCGGEGRLLLMEDTTDQRLYLHCEECEHGFWHPDDVPDPDKAFLTLTEEFDAEPATRERIDELGWSAYARHEYDDG
jgi:hypothetical protein